MITLPNAISLLRIPLAFLYLKEDPFLRAMAILLAMVSDGLDGYLARRYNMVSKSGILLDPFTDRFFVFFVLGVFLLEHRLTGLEAAALVCRDVSLLLFGCYLAIRGKLKNYKFRAIWCGKATTFLQFVHFFALTLLIPVPPYIFGVYVILGILAFIELYLTKEAVPSTT